MLAEGDVDIMSVHGLGGGVDEPNDPRIIEKIRISMHGARAGPESLQMQRFPCIFMVWAVWCGGAGRNRIIGNAKISMHRHGLGVGVGGPGDRRAIENSRFPMHFKIWAMAWGARAASGSMEIRRFPNIFTA